MAPSMQSIVITGGAGFIGGHVATHFLKLGFKVICIDDLSSGTQENIDRLKSLGKDLFTLFQGNINDRAVVKKALEYATTVDCVGCVHLAAKVSVPLLNEHPELAISDNVIGFDIVLSECHRSNIPRFVYASSSAVYGDQKVLPIPETANLGPTNVYGWSKLSNEVSASAYLDDPDFGVVGLRFFNVFGPNQDPNGPYAAVIPRWIEAACAGEDINIFGDGLNTRDFISVQEITDFIHHLIKPDTNLRHSIFNVGRGRATDLNELAQIMQNIAGTMNNKINVTYTSARTGDIKHSVADTSRMQSLLTTRNETRSLRDDFQTLAAAKNAAT